MISATSLPAWARGQQQITYSFEPVIGFERVQKLAPTPHASNRLVYGVRGTAGIPLLSAEAELTRGQDSEYYPTLGRDIKDTDDKLKLGLRSGYALTQLLSVHGRAGGQAKRNTHEETSGGVTTKTSNGLEYDPYAGAGMRFALGSNVSFSADVTVVFNDLKRLSQNDYQTTAGFQIRFP